MTTPLTQSPFSSDIKNNNPAPEHYTPPIAAPVVAPAQDDFLIRTMQDDLINLQNKGSIEEVKKDLPAAKNIQPLQQNLNNPKIPFDKATVSSEKISSFMQRPENTAAKNIVEIPATTNISGDTITNKRPASLKIILALVVVITIAIIGLGSYYYLLTKKAVPVVAAPAPQPVESQAPQPQIPVPAAPATTVQPPVQKYSEEKPNYLTLDLSTMTSDQIKAAIVGVTDELKDTQMHSPYEFIVVDANNNPVAFPIFATAAKLNLSPTLLSSLGTDFSLYIYNDNSNMRLAIAASISNKANIAKQLTAQEPTFLTNGSFLFLNAIPEIKTGTFATSTYGNYTIRFLNANAAKDLSIDYTMTDSRLIIGTSKNTERAVLDKISSQSAMTTQAAPSQANSSTSTPSTSAQAASVAKPLSQQVANPATTAPPTTPAK